jgi:DNA (cytosine-5)-methyltransferase 1
MRTMHLFAGGGGGMYADLILGHTPTVAVEWDKHACNVLRARKEDGWWPECEIIEGDIRAFCGVRYAGEVDCIHAGFPCQDLSVAGNRAGLDGDRSSLYVEALRIFGEVRPRYLFLENVPGVLTANGGEALNRIMSDLAALGLDARWTCLRASDVGANHRRDRWWCLASNSDRPEHGRWSEPERGEVKRDTDSSRHGAQRDVADTKPDGLEGTEPARGSPPTVRRRSAEQGQDISDASLELFDRPGSTGKAGGRESTNFCSDDVPISRRRSSKGPRREECSRQGQTWWFPEPPVGRVANGVAGRVHRLKMLGNGQVPLQAAFAWIMLGGPHNGL